MNEIDVIGFIGVSLILIAYFLNLNNKLYPKDISYILLNLIGAALACLASILMAYYPFVLLEGTWTFVSLVALMKHLKKDKMTPYN
jgi:hypothetical protein